MKIAIPSLAPGGLQAPISAHFGHCETFTLVEVGRDGLGSVELIPNQPHSQGGCMAPVNLLKQAGAEVMVAGGMGARPLSGFQQAGIKVFFSGHAQNVQQAVELVESGQAREFGPAQVCGGGQGNCGRH